MPSLKKLRVLIYSPLSLELQGGGERWLAEVAPRLKEYNIIPTIVTTDFLPKHYTPKTPIWHLQRFRMANIDQFRIPTSKLFWSLNLPVLTPHSLVDLLRLIKKHDAVYFMNAYAFQDISMMIMKHIAGKIPLICGQHAALFQNGKLHNGYVSLVTRAISRSFDAIHVLNKRDAQQYSSWGSRNIYIIPNGVDVQQYLNKNFHGSDEFSVLFVGRLDEQKGLDVLLRAIEYLETTHSFSKRKISFLICGAGPMTDEVRKFAQKRDNVDHLGFISEEELPKIYRAADLFILPSRHETFGLVAIEAMASGLPVVASNIPGPQDIIENTHGQLVKVGDYEGLANAVLHFQSIQSNMPEKYDNMRLQVRKYVEAKYNWKIVIKQLATMIRETVHRSR
jgi:glycosyltransferase involved in cell wall biosynthesis